MARQIVGEIFLNVKPLDGGVNAGVQRIIDNASDQAAEVPVDADTEAAQQAVAGLSAQIEEDVGGAWIVATAQAAAFTAAIIGAKRQIEGTVAQLGGLFDQLAQAQAGFTAILGSEAAGSQLLDDIREFARVTPFVTQELVNYSQQLLGVGQSAESIVPLLGSVGDVIASVGGDTQNISRVLFTLTQIRSIGRLVGQDAIQLQSSLIPITKILADFLDITTEEVKKLQEAGSISADTVFEAITAQGERVEGAMLTATRNIRGAQAVLSDSIEILLQNSVFLQAVFEDIVEGMLRFDEALAGQDIQNTIATISESLESIYQDIQPAIEGFIELSAGLGVSAIQVLASSLEILAGAIEAVPAEAFRVLGQALAVYAALRAPIALINYVNTLRSLASQITPERMVQRLNQTGDGIRRTGQEAAAAAPQVERMSRAMQNTITAAAGLALAAGTVVKALGDGNEAAETFGSTLQGAGLGAQLGSTFGPKGTLIGLAAGAGIGFVTSFVTNARDEANRTAEELAAVGEESATAFLEAFALRISNGLDTSEEFAKAFDRTEELRSTITAYDELIEKRDELQAQADALANNIEFTDRDSTGFQYDQIRADLEDVERQLELTSTGAETARAELESLFSEGILADAISDISSKLAALNLETPEFGEKLADALSADNFAGFEIAGQFFDIFDLQLLATGQTVIESQEQFRALELALGLVGLSIDDLGLELEELNTQITGETSSAFARITGDTKELKKAFDEAKKAASEAFAPFKFQVDQAKSAVEQAGKLAEAQKKIVEEGIEGTGFGYAEVLLQSVEALTAANETVFDDSPRAIADGLSFAKVALEELQEQTGLTDAAFQDFLESVGLLDLFLSTEDVDSGFAGSLNELSSTLGVTTDDLREILRISDQIDNEADFTVTADTLSAIENIKNLEYQAAISGGDIEESSREAREELSQMVTAGGAYRTAADDIKEAGEVIIDSLNEYVTEIQRIQTVLAQGSGLADAYEQIQATGEGQENFADALIENFQSVAQASLAVYDDQQRAVDAGLSFVRATLESLQDDLQLTDDAFFNLLQTMGLVQIYNDALGVDSGFFGSIDELVAQTGIENALLREMLGLTDALAGTTTIVIDADTTEALLAIDNLMADLEVASDAVTRSAIQRYRGELQEQIDAQGGARVLESNVLEDALAAAEEERQRALQEAERERQALEREQATFIREQEQLLQSYESANETVASALESAANQIENAARQWVAGIQERVQQDRAVPIDRLIRNAGQQGADLEFLNEALQTLERRGLSQSAIEAIGIDGLGDVRQVQRLLSASDAQLRELSSLVNQRDANAEAIARRQQREETQATIVAAILQAASILDLDLTPAQANALSAQFIINGNTTSADLPEDFVNQLLNVGQIVRS